MYYTFVPSPVGKLLLARIDALSLIGFSRGANPTSPQPDWKRADTSLLRQAARQLDEYFAGERRAFDLALKPSGTPFQLAVLNALATIPYGETRSYGEIAAQIGRPKAVRAVGAANGRNPLPIVLPCRRHIGADGSLTGFGGGLSIKRYLLHFENPKCGDPGQGTL